MVVGEAPAGTWVALTGFEPLTADVLALALTRRGMPAVALSSRPRGTPDPGVVVAALDHNTLDQLEELRAAMPKIPIVAVVHSATGPLRQVARQSAVAAVLVRSEGLGRLTEVLDLALAGDTVAIPDDAATSPLGVLTAREITVLRLVAGGSTNAEIGTALGISPHTARTHVQKVMGKLGVRTRLGAGVVAREAGLTSGGTL